jgi:diguanylate cyclase (GGDEF)-like protein
MSFDLDTLFFATAFTSAIAGGLLLLTWLQHRDVVALALWGAGFAFGSAGLALIILRGVVPDIWSIVIGNTILAIAYGVGWLGVRAFEGRSLNVPVALAGAAVWLASCVADTLYAAPRARVAVMMCIIITYTLLNAWEFYRARDTALMSRWPIIVVLLAHAAVLMLRIPLAGTWPGLGAERSPLDLHVALVLEAMLVAFCVAYLLGSMARERIVLKLQRDALTDPLTEVANRRAFFEQGERLLRRARQGRHLVAVLAFDLDRFKTINDRFGHRTGDFVLKTFCDVATASLRPGDLFGRIGGEEFACLLPNASHAGGMQVAERIRARFAGLDVIVDGTTIDTTVSVGVASSEDQELSLPGLVAAADRALYDAKDRGRNRVELARSQPSRPISLVPQDGGCDLMRASSRSARVK